MCRQRGTLLILHCRPGALELLLTKQVDEIFIATLERDLALAVLRLVELGVAKRRLLRAFARLAGIRGTAGQGGTRRVACPL